MLRRLAPVSAIILACLVISCSGGGPQMVNLTRGASTIDGLPAWSPDGSLIAFFSRPTYEIYASGEPVTSHGIWVMDPDGGNRVQVAEMSGEYLSGISWSPAGEILFCSMLGGIGVVDLQGDCRYVVSDNLDDLLYSSAVDSPSFSPEGTKTLFARILHIDSTCPIMVVDAEGGEPVQLTPDGTSNQDPSWSPDGRIVFVSNRDGMSDIYVMDADGSDVIRLTEDAFPERTPVWSPDGSRIAFVSVRDDVYDVLVMDSDGQNVVRLTENGESVFEQSLSWSPDGTRLAVGGWIPPGPPDEEDPGIGEAAPADEGKYNIYILKVA